MLVQRRSRWTNIDQALCRCHLLAGPSTELQYLVCLCVSYLGVVVVVVEYYFTNSKELQYSKRLLTGALAREITVALFRRIRMRLS